MNTQSLESKKNIVILGAGFGGIACALRLEKQMRRKRSFCAQFNIVLVDRKNYHLYTPNLYEVATTPSEEGPPLILKKATCIPIEEIMRGKRIIFIQNQVSGVQVKAREIRFDDFTSIKYEYLVLALGSEPAGFGIPGIRKYAFALKRFEDGIHLRNVIRKKHEEKQQGEKLQIVVGGGGTTGVEFSAALINYIRKLNHKEKKTIKLQQTLVEGTHHILPSFDQGVINKASARLSRLGILLKTGLLISRADSGVLYLQPAQPADKPGEPFTASGETLKYDVLIWTGGIQANPSAQAENLIVDKRGKIKTDEFLKCLSTGHNQPAGEKIYAAGDNAAFYDSALNCLAPDTAPVAIAQGKRAAENIYRSISGKLPKKYVLKKYPFVIPIGGKFALAKIGPFLLSGFSAWVLNQLIELFYLFSIIRFQKALRLWWGGFEIFSKNG